MGFEKFISETLEFTRCRYKNRRGHYGSRGKCDPATGVEDPLPRNAHEEATGRRKYKRSSDVTQPVSKDEMASPDLPLGHQAFLLTLQNLEGTDKSKTPYFVMFGGKNFATNSNRPDHPRQIVHGISDAAGAYQFLSTTWDDFAKATGTKDFTPANQDKAAMWLIKSRISDKEYSDLAQGKLSPKTIHKLALEWASMPCSDGKSCYGQPSKSEKDILRIYRNNMLRLGS